MDATLEMGRQQSAVCQRDQQHAMDDVVTPVFMGATKYKYRHLASPSLIVPPPPPTSHLRHADNVPETTL